MTAPSKRLCIVHTSGMMARLLTGIGPPVCGGAEVQLNIIARMLAQRGWAISFAVGDHGQAPHFTTPDGIELITAFRHSAGLPLARIFTHYVPGLRRAVAQADADVYLLEGADWMLGPVAAFVRRHRRRLAFWLASRTDAVLGGPGRVRLPARDRWLYKYGLRRTDLLVCQTQEQVDLLPVELSERATIVPNLWPTDGSPPPEKHKPFEVLWAARGIPLKRPHMVLDVAGKLPDIRFVMIGGPSVGHEPLYDSVVSRAREVPNVELKGWVPFEKTPEHYARASVLLCTSTVEGFPNTFLQAWEAGAVVVSTYDPDEVLCEHEVGFHGSDVDTIADAIRRLEADKDLWTQTATRARARLESVHAPDAVIGRLEAVLHPLIAAGDDH